MLQCDLGDGYAMPYIEVGQGPPLVVVHGSMSDFRIWGPVLGPLSKSYRVVAPSLRYFFPGHWPKGTTNFTIAQHTADVIAFLGRLQGRVHLLGHSRGGHICLRVAEARPDLLMSLTLLEPGGDLDDTLQPADEPRLPPLNATYVSAASKIANGDIEDGLELFMDAINGEGMWRRLPQAMRQEMRDNATTMLGQMDEQRKPMSRATAERIHIPTLLVDGGATKPASSRNVQALAAHIPGARRVTIPKTSHMMFIQDPVGFCAAVLAFLDEFSTRQHAVHHAG